MRPRRSKAKAAASRLAALVLMVGLAALRWTPLEALAVEVDFEPATFEVAGDRLYMRGTIHLETPADLAQQLLRNPQVKTIVMLEVPGSVDDFANFVAAYLVRLAGLNTHLTAQSEIASGGTDFFLAGVKRTAEVGARLGVHSWQGENEEGRLLPRSHQAHRMYLDYYRNLNIPAAFYWFTLETPAEDLHWMTPEEIKRYGLITE